MFKKAFNLLVLLAFVVALLKAGNVSAYNKGMITLWSVKVNSTQTIGMIWSTMDSYQYTCRSERVINLSGKGETLMRVIYWPNFYNEKTLVSTDTVCSLTSKSWGWVDKYTQAPFLYRQIGSNFFEAYTDLIYASQVRSFSYSNPGLVCKANSLGMERWDSDMNVIKQRYEKAIFKPYIGNGGWVGGWLYASRDLTCTTDVVQINRWMRNPYWTFIKLP